jgi:hypothetical protein
LIVFLPLVLGFSSVLLSVFPQQSIFPISQACISYLNPKQRPAITGQRRDHNGSVDAGPMHGSGHTIQWT